MTIFKLYIFYILYTFLIQVKKEEVGPSISFTDKNLLLTRAPLTFTFRIELNFDFFSDHSCKLAEGSLIMFSSMTRIYFSRHSKVCFKHKWKNTYIVDKNLICVLPISHKRITFSSGFFSTFPMSGFFPLFHVSQKFLKDSQNLFIKMPVRTFISSRYQCAVNSNTLVIRTMCEDNSCMYNSVFHIVWYNV